MDYIVVFWTSLIFLIILSLGLLIDIILAVIYWEKWPGLFRSSLAKVPWYFKDVLIICIALFLVLFLVDSLINILGLADKEKLKPLIGILNTVGKYGLCIWIIVRFLHRRYGAGWRELGFRWKKTWRLSLKGFLLYLGFIPILAVLTYISLLFCSVIGITPEPHQLVEILLKEKSLWYILYLIVVASFFAPIFEEIIFRGLIYQGLKKHIGTLKAVLISSALFSLLHFNTAQFIPVMGLGILLCFIFEYTGSLVPVILIHMANNGLFMGLFLLLKDYM